METKTTSASLLVVTPCKDEQEYARQSIESVLRQTVLPACWIIVDDGSSDGTLEILREYEQKVDFLKVVVSRKAGDRRVGAGVIAAFECGLGEVDIKSFNYICKLDLDLDLPSSYFEQLIALMSSDPRLGSCSGKPYALTEDGSLRAEPTSDDISAGMTKFYKVDCYSEIGGFIRNVMWDGIDCHKCRMLGWKARSFDHEGLRFVHLRAMGSSQKGILTGRMRHGYGQYFMGTSFMYLLVSCIYRIGEYPIFVGSVATLYGYLRSLAKREARFDDQDFRRYLRRYQWRTLLLGRKKALLEAEGASVEMKQSNSNG